MLDLNFNHMFVIKVLMTAYELKNIRRLNVKSVIDLDVFYGISVEMRL